MPKRPRIALFAACFAALAAGCGEPAREEPPAPQSKITNNTIEFPNGSPQLADGRHLT